MRILPSRSAPALLSAHQSRVMARRNHFQAPFNSRSYTKVCIPSAQTDARLNACFSAETALATLQGRQILGLSPPVILVLSPYPPTSPPTPLPPPSASPRLVKHLPPNYSDYQLFDLFRPFGALASVRAQTSFGQDTGLVEFWRDEDARRAEEALHCAEVDGQNIAVQLYNRRGSGVLSEFSPRAPPFVPSGSAYPSPYPTQVSFQSPNRSPLSHSAISIRPQERAHTILAPPYRSFMARASRFNSHHFMVQDPPVTAASSILATCSVRCALPTFLPTIARPCPSES
jgi:hypothetical protein